MKEHGIRDRITTSRQLAFFVSRCAAGIVPGHIIMSNDLLSKAKLRQEKTIKGTSGSNANKE